MLVSLIIPACDAQATIGRAVESLVAQDWPDWEGIVVADDGFDYRAFLAASGPADPRLVFVSTGRRRSGCHRARNVGLAAARGELVGALDADDAFRPGRIASLAPLAHRHGAAADNLAVISEDDGTLMYRVMGQRSGPVEIDIAAFLALTAPLVPLVRRDLAEPRIEGVEYAEDVIANLVLIDRIGRLPVIAEAGYAYFIRAGSIANDDRAGDEFERAYSDYIERLAGGDGFGLSPANREPARLGLIGKRELNRRFSAAFRHDRTLNFQSFIARTRRER